MIELTQLSPGAEDALLGEELDKLFVFQDKHLSKEKRAILVKALVESGIPFRALLLGVRKLMGDDLASIKMGTICAAARSFVEPSEAGKGCQDCLDGLVVMRDEEGRWFSLACQCGRGFNVKQSHGLRAWGGESSQLVNGRVLAKAM